MAALGGAADSGDVSKWESSAPLVGRQKAIPPARRLFGSSFLAHNLCVGSNGLGKIVALAGQRSSKTLIVAIVVGPGREFSLVVE